MAARPGCSIPRLLFVGLQAALLLVLPAAGRAGPYLEGGLGFSYARALTLDRNGAHMEFDRGRFQRSAALGWRFRAPYRLELEYLQSDNAPEILFSAAAGVEADSDRRDEFSLRGVVLNGLRELHIGPAWRGYVGAGIGVARSTLHFSEIEVPGLNLPRLDVVNDEHSGVVVQAIAGMDVPLTRRLRLAADYRFRLAPNVDLRDAQGASLEFDHGIHSAWLRLRYSRGDAPGVARAMPTGRRHGYFALRSGGSFTQDVGFNNDVTLDALHPSGVIGMAYGWQLRPRWQLELEAGTRRNRVEVVDFGPEIGEDAADGHFTTRQLLVNAAFLMRPGRAVRPLLGVGVGLVDARLAVSTMGFCRNFRCGELQSEPFVRRSRDQALAVQLRFGVQASLTPRWSVGAELRYLGTDTLRYRRADGSPVRGQALHKAAVLGLRYRLGS